MAQVDVFVNPNSKTARHLPNLLARLVAMPTNVSTPHSIDEMGTDSAGVRTLLHQSQLPAAPSLVATEPPGELAPEELSDRFDYFSIIWQPAQ